MRTKRVVAGVVWAMLFALHASAQVGVWKNYTSMQDARSIARSGNIFWAATSGGLFSWQEGTETYTKFTSAEGLQSTDVTAVAVDRNGDVWSGTSGGMIHVYTPSKNLFRYIPDITTTNQTNKKINNILVFGDSVLICSEFGLSVFRNDRFQFGDTYTKFGQLAGTIRVSVTSAATFGGKLWAIVSDRQSVTRIASARLSNPNLLPPEAWTLEAIGQAVPRHLAVFNNRLYVGTSGGVFVQSGGAWTAVDSLAGVNVLALSASATTLAIVDADRRVVTLNTQHAVDRTRRTPPHAPTSVILNARDSAVLGTTTGGIITLHDTTWTPHFPNGPQTNAFISVAVDQDGNVWGATGLSGSGTGFHRFDGKTWKTFTRSNSSSLPTNDTWRVSATCNGDVWLTVWGANAAAIRIPRGAQQVDSANVFDVNDGFPHVSDGPGGYVAGAPVCDSRGNTWFPIMKPVNRKGLVVRTSTGAIINLPATIANAAQIFDDFRHVSRGLAVDGFDNLWIAAVNPSRGAASLNNRGSVTDSVADFLLTAENGLPNETVTCIVADREGDIWIGTDNGIAIVLDPSNPTRQGGVANYKPLSGPGGSGGTGINAIAVDPLNQKWIATNEGAVLLSRDGTQTLAQFNLANTSGKIISNEIKDIAIDAKSGTVYFATTGGLASLTTTAAQPNESFDELIVSPNPYRIPNAVPLQVDGLVENSKIKILTIDGHLVRELETPGGRIGFWDGKDEKGNDVASGVYLVVAYSADNSGKVGKGKVAVLRK
jgi:ligand-binding sensor domain-containing protein